MFETELTRTEETPAGIVMHEVRERDDHGPEHVYNIYSVYGSFTTLDEWRTVNEPGSRHRWKSWQHYKCASQTSSGLGTSAQAAIEPRYQLKYNGIATASGPGCFYNSRFGALGRLNDGLTPLYISTAGGKFIPQPEDINGLIASALRSMLPVIRAELSSVNSTIELKDFASLKGTLRNIAKLPKGLLRKGRYLKNIAQLLQVAADVYLQAKFNILPLISDVNGIYRALAKTERRINDLVSRAGKLQSKHFRCKIGSQGITQETEGLRSVFGYRLSPSGSDFSTGCQGLNERFVDTDASFHAQLQFNYHYSAYQLEHARVLALLDAFGVNLNPQIIWNAIPWSFVVDWLVDVGQWLGNTRIGNMDPKINIMQFLWSSRTHRRITVTTKVFPGAVYYSGYDPFGPALPSVGVTHPVVFETAYRRDAGLPPVSLLTTSGLSSTEFSLGAALAITRRRHGPKKHK